MSQRIGGRALLLCCAAICGLLAYPAADRPAGGAWRPLGAEARGVDATGVDLTVRSLVKREAIAESWRYEALVANTGDQAAGAFGVTLEGFECGSPRGDSGLYYRENQRVPSVDAGGVVTVTWQTTLGCTWARAVADPDREANDADRSDNTLDIWFRREPITYEVGTIALTREGNASNWQMPNGGRSQSAGYFGDFWFTSGSASRTQASAYGVWSISVPPGIYRLYAYIPRHGDLNGQRKPDAPSAVYQVWDQRGRWRDAVTIDQERFADLWVPLGSFPLSWTSRVRLGDNVGAPTTGGTWVIFDAIRAVSE